MLLIVYVVCVFMVISISHSYGKYILDNNVIAAQIDIDRTKPEGMVTYIQADIEKEEAFVTVVLNEPILPIEGWTFEENGLKMTKKYENKIKDIITITDLSGNENIIEIN